MTAVYDLTTAITRNAYGTASIYLADPVTTTDRRGRTVQVYAFHLDNGDDPCWAQVKGGIIRADGTPGQRMLTLDVDIPADVMAVLVGL